MLKFIKNKNGFKSWQADGFRIYYGKKGSIAGGNNINPAEKIYLLKGEAKITIESEKHNLIAPAEIKIPANIYHKIEARQGIIFLVFKK